MIRSRLGLRAISLCLALAGLMAVCASSAQAETGAFWEVLEVNGEGKEVGKKAVTDALKAALAGSLENKDGTLLGSIAGVGIHILCTDVTFATGNQLLVNGGLKGKVKFEGCKISRLKAGVAEPLAACTPPGGVIETTEGKGLLGLHVLPEGKGTHIVTVLEPASGTLFTTINTGEECAFGEKITINGKLAVVDAEASTNKVTHLITEFKPLTELYINSNKANSATIDGSAEVKLAGAHAGFLWSGKA